MSGLLKNGKILVTGADGFIGSHLVEELVRRGYETKALVQYNSFGTWGWLDHCDSDVKGHFEVSAGDIRDAYSIKTIMSDCDSVIHLAALIAIPYSYLAPEMYIDTNIKGTLNVLQAARELEISKIVHTSTSEVYGTAIFVPISESHPLQGQSPYSASKIGADQLVQAFHSSYDLPTITVRPFNTFGPRQSARAIIPTVISQISSGSRTVKVGSTSPTRDFTFVDDTVAGFIAALESNQGLGEVFNLGSNFEVSIAETISLIAELMQTEVIVEEDSERMRPSKSEVDRLWADNSKASQILNWNPKVNGREGFRLGLDKTIEWFNDEGNLVRYKSGIYNV